MVSGQRQSEERPRPVSTRPINGCLERDPILDGNADLEEGDYNRAEVREAQKTSESHEKGKVNTLKREFPNPLKCANG